MTESSVGSVLDVIEGLGLDPRQLDALRGLTEEELRALWELSGAFSGEVKKAYPTATAADLITFAQSDFYIKDTKRPILLYDPQPLILGYMFWNGHESPFQTYMYSTIKKSGKSTIASMIARWVAETYGPYQEVYIVANDEEQARGILYEKMMQSFQFSPGWDERTRILPGKWRVIDRVLTHIPTKSVVKALSGDYRGQAGSEPTGTFWTELWAYHCCDQETEFMTRNGWRNYQTIRYDEELATLSADGKLEWQYPSAIIRQKYVGDMYRFTHRRSDMLVTPNHRVFGKFLSNARYKVVAHERKTEFRAGQGDEWRCETAEVAAKYRLGWVKSDAEWEADDIYTYEIPAYRERPPKVFDADHWMEFLGWYTAEGHCGCDNPYVVNISQSQRYNPEKWARIKELLTEMLLNFSEGPNGFLIFDIQLGSYLAGLGLAHDKYVPRDIKNVSKRQLSIFFQAYLAGDGWKPNREKRDEWQCTTVSRVLADDLLEIGLKCGYMPRLMSVSEAGETTRPAYRLSFSHGAIAWERAHNHWSKELYSGMVWCVTVPNGTVYARRNGHCYWTGNSEASLRLWDELTPVPTRPHSFRFIDTYAGFEGESELLWDLWQRALNGRRVTNDELIKICGRPWYRDGEDIPLWINQTARLCAYIDQGPVARRLPWQTEEYYRAEAIDLRPEAFDRLHNNYWVSAVGEFIPAQWWEACYDPDLPDYAGENMLISADAAVSGDCCAMLGLTRDPRNSERLVLREAVKWDAPTRGTFNYMETMEPQAKDWCKRYPVLQIAYDPYQLHDMSTRLGRSEDQIAWWKPFSQNLGRLTADFQLYCLIRDRRIRYKDRALGVLVGEHIRNANSMQSAREDTKLRIVKKGKSLHVDLVVCLSMAASEALRLDM